MTYFSDLHRVQKIGQEVLQFWAVTHHIIVFVRLSHCESLSGQLRPVYSNTTRVELSWQSVYSDADTTQLDVELSTCSRREQLSPIDVELSCVAINGPLHFTVDKKVAAKWTKV